MGATRTGPGATGSGTAPLSYRKAPDGFLPGSGAAGPQRVMQGCHALFHSLPPAPPHPDPTFAVAVASARLQLP